MNETVTVKQPRSITLHGLILPLTCLLIVRVTISVVLNYRDYIPPNFESDFLSGRQGYFWNGYHLAFYPHLASGPVSLILGVILVNDRFRLQFPHWHRLLGRVQVICVLFLVVPSGLWMAFYAMTGTVAAIGFASLAVATGLCVTLGWRSAVLRQFAIHRRWMLRCFVLLCSAVVIRMIGGLATVTDFDADWLYPLSAWACWLVPLAVFEARQRSRWLPRT